MAEQRWFAGLPVVSQRELDAVDDGRLNEIVRSIRFESLGSYAITAIALTGVVAASTLMTASGWLGPLALGVMSGLLRYLPQRRFFTPRVLIGLRRDIIDRIVFVCQSDELTIEVLSHSHVIWSRNGATVEPLMVAHATATAFIPEHAQMAAKFVRPLDDDSSVHVHQRALTPNELEELNSYAPRPRFAVWVLAVVGLLGGFATFGLALAGRLTTLLPPFAFIIIGTWAGISAFRAWRARKIIASDLEAGVVVIVRLEENGELGPPEELLPFSQIVWTFNGVTPEWRKRLRKL